MKYQVIIHLIIATVTIAATGCTHQAPQLYATMQADGWSAQPIVVHNRYTPDVSLDHDSGIPLGDEGYYFYILTSANKWDYRDAYSFVYSLIEHPSGHTWMILESPLSRLECGHTGNYGLMKPRYHNGVIQRIRDNDPNPIAYLWETMCDGQLEVGNPGYEPSFVWRMPITKRGYERIYEYIMNREYNRFSLSAYNCSEMVTTSASLVGVNLTSLIRVTFPAQGIIHGHNLRVWTDPQYRGYDIRSIDVLELDLRHLANMGIGSDATTQYKASKPYQPRVKLNHPSELRPINLRPTLVRDQAKH